MVHKEKLEDVVFTGYVPYADLPRYYKSANVFCAPATGLESFGIVLLEAMAVGIPVIASDIEGYASVVSHGIEGFLVPPRDEKALARAITSLIEDEGLRCQMGARGRLKAEQYSWPLIAQQLIDYYQRMLPESTCKERSSAVEA